MASDKIIAINKSSYLPTWNKWLTMLLRLFVGGVFAFSGFVKAIDPWGTIYKVNDYLAAFQIVMPDSIVLFSVFSLLGILVLVWSVLEKQASLPYPAS